MTSLKPVFIVFGVHGCLENGRVKAQKQNHNHGQNI